MARAASTTSEGEAGEHVLLEACVESVACAEAALLAGADRVELCAHLSAGGVTPSVGAIERTVAAAGGGAPVVVLVRPRPGDFVYTPGEFAVARADIEAARRAGAGAVAIGFLDREGDVDRTLTAEAVAAARPMRVVFHRALDRARRPDAALELLAELGIDRVLTAGGAACAEDGLAALAAFVDRGTRAGDSLEVVAAGGVRAHNARAIREATGCRELHFRASRGPDEGEPSDLAFGGAPRPDPELVRAVRAAVGA